MKKVVSCGLAVVVVALLAAFAGEAAAQGCAMCKTAVGGPLDPLAKGINTSILFMMATPFALFVLVGGWLTYMFWNHPPAGVGDAGEGPDLTGLRAKREGSR